MLRVRGPGANGGLGLRASEDLWFQNPPPPLPTFTPSPRRLGGAPLSPPPPTLPQLFGAPAGCLVELLAGAWGGVLGVGVVVIVP